MKRLIVLAILGLMVLGVEGCSSVRPLKMKYYRKNVVVKADRTVWVNNAKINMDRLRDDFLAQMIFQDTPIAVHFHKDLTQDYFDQVMGRIKGAGFRNYDCIVYRD